jgi:hypothetical protein
VGAVATATDRGHNLTIEICRDSTGPSQLTFARRNEVDLAVLAGDKTVWRWSVGHADAAAAHTLAADADSCWSWTAPWTDVDASGRRLESGSYALSVTSTAREVSAVDPQQVTFRVS